MLEQEHGFVKVSFADSLKDAVAAVFGWPRDLLEGDTAASREWREELDPWWAQRLDIPHLTPRWVLQYWGTEVLRRGFHNDIWVASIEHKVQDASKNYVIPDTRFPNEIEMIARTGGNIWLVKRGEDPEWFQKYQSHRIIPEDIHASEWAWALSKFDHTIANDSTLTQLKQTVQGLIS